MTESTARDRWESERTTFQRVYDLLVGTAEPASASEFADGVDCSETAARDALEQLAEMGIAERRDGRPATYCRNDAYLRWKRVESLVCNHTTEQLRERLEALVTRDEKFQTEFGVPTPEAVSVADVPNENHEAMEQQWDALGEWRTVRSDIQVLRRAVERAARRGEDTVSA
jgi:predicted transcriptional regulator